MDIKALFVVCGAVRIDDRYLQCALAVDGRVRTPAEYCRVDRVACEGSEDNGLVDQFPAEFGDGTRGCAEVKRCYEDGSEGKGRLGGCTGI